MVLNNLLILSYDGSSFYGWQKQPDFPTVQGEVERVLSILFNDKIRVIGAGRTDRGVHALRQYANFYSPCVFGASFLKKSLNSLLPPEIRVLKVITGVNPAFNARKHAIWREYKYFIYSGEVLPPFLHRYCYHLKRKIDVSIITDLTDVLIGTHDFSAFCDGEEKTKSKIRTIYRCSFEKKGNLFVFTIRANSFLRHMVRVMLATLIDIASGKREKELFIKALSSGDRTLCSAALPPQGLWLWRVGFPTEVYAGAVFSK
ncbi:MAG: tRNA pseudouridine38-40 synthase [bacterium]|nr:tRNA pseudouridine38-40 synthase [bacterium]